MNTNDNQKKIEDEKDDIDEEKSDEYNDNNINNLKNNDIHNIKNMNHENNNYNQMNCPQIWIEILILWRSVSLLLSVSVIVLSGIFIIMFFIRVSSEIFRFREIIRFCMGVHYLS